MRTPFYAANWKMHKTIAEASYFAAILLQEPISIDREVVIGASATLLAPLAGILEESAVAVAAQNMFYEEEGAFTGELSPLQVADTGATYVIVGHSERRGLFGETDDIVAKKLQSAEKHGLTAIFCLGETLEQRNAGTAAAVVTAQLHSGLAGLSAEYSKNIIIAYEPIWAIGTGETASPEQAEEIHSVLRALLPDQTRVIYGGSVKPANCAELLEKPSIDGFLIGGASLDPASFRSILT